MYGAKQLLLTFILTSISFFLFAAGIKGKVLDAQTGEPLVGATISVKNTNYKTTVNLDGGFFLKNIPDGSYKIEVSNVGYSKKEVDVSIASGRDVNNVLVLLSPASSVLREVVVASIATGESDKAVRRLEQKSDIVQNVLSAKTIQLSPDVTVANALQRMSGVTIQRSRSGEGRYAVIRGMDKRYNNTLVNGIKIPSPDDKFRFVPMDIFPSEMLERLEVIKTLTPNMEPDAIGGTMNLVMKNAPEKFWFTANGSLGYSTLFSDRSFSSFNHSGINKKSPAEIHGNDYAATYPDFTISNLIYRPKTNPLNSTIGATIGNRFLNKKMGVIVSASYQDFYRGSNSDYLIPNAQPNPVPDNSPFFSDVYKRQFSTHTDRIGLHNKIDYVINSRNKLSLYNLYVHQNEFETRFTADTVIGINSTTTKKLVDVENRSRWQIQSVYNATLQGDHKLTNALSLNWIAVYSLAKQMVPDMAKYVHENDVNFDGAGKITTVDSFTKSMSRIWAHNSDKDIAGYLNLTYFTKLAKRNIEFSWGGLARRKTRDNYYNEYSLKPAPQGQQQRFHDIQTAQFGFTSTNLGKGSYTALTPNYYTVKENTYSGYIQTKFLLTKKLLVVGGVRVEGTEQHYNTVMPENFDARYGTIKYTDVLPSLHLKYELTKKQNIRLSYYKSISRPGFGEIVPYEIPGDYFDEIGNPYLKHTRADNLDFRYELFPGAADQVLLGFFYKDIQDPIEYFVVRNGGPSAQFIKPDNVNKATNYGAEAVITKYFGKFGFSANYTYTHSKVTTNKLYYYYDPTLGNTQKVVSQARPLQGQADHVGNISLLYKNQNFGLDMQLAFVYTGQRIYQVSPYYGLDYWNDPYSQLDFSFEKTLVKHFSFYAKVNNITDAPNKVHLKYPANNIPTALSNQDDPNKKVLVQKDIYKVSFLGGLRFKF